MALKQPVGILPRKVVILQMSSRTCHQQQISWNILDVVLHHLAPVQNLLMTLRQRQAKHEVNRIMGEQTQASQRFDRFQRQVGALLHLPAAYQCCGVGHLTLGIMRRSLHQLFGSKQRPRMIFL